MTWPAAIATMKMSRKRSDEIVSRATFNERIIHPDSRRGLPRESAPGDLYDFKVFPKKRSVLFRSTRGLRQRRIRHRHRGRRVAQAPAAGRVFAEKMN